MYVILTSPSWHPKYPCIKPKRVQCYPTSQASMANCGNPCDGKTGMLRRNVLYLWNVKFHSEQSRQRGPSVTLHPMATCGNLWGGKIGMYKRNALYLWNVKFHSRNRLKELIICLTFVIPMYVFLHPHLAIPNIPALSKRGSSVTLHPMYHMAKCGDPWDCKIGV